MLARTLTWLLLAAAAACPAAAQVPNPPYGWYRTGTMARFSIYNSSVQWSGSAAPTAAVYTAGSVGLAGGGAGSAAHGAMTQTPKASMNAHLNYGRFSYQAALQAEVGGERFVDQNTVEYLTGALMAACNLEMGYSDEISVQSSTLPAGSNVTIRMRLHHFARRSYTRTWPEWAEVPPTSPGGATTYVHRMRSSTDQQFWSPSTHEASVHSLRPDGSLQQFFRAERKTPGTLEFNFTGVVGGKIRLGHAFATHSLEAATRAASGSQPGERTANHSSSGVCSLNLWAVTDGVTLASLSGTVYAPATGPAALLQSQTLGSNLLLTAPEGAIFQKASFTPAGLSWTDLPESQLLTVPMNETKAFYRVRTP